MRSGFAAFCVLAFVPVPLAQAASAQHQAQTQNPAAPPTRAAAAQNAPKTQSAMPQAAKDLPVRKVVLYKNGVGYFEHAGIVSGNQRVSIDFTSPQLNDVLQSLTVLDQGGGHIAGVNYNSTMPLDEQLKSLSLGMTDNPTSTELFQALRGQRVEVTGGPGGAISGRLMSIESRTERVGAGDSAGTIDRYFLTLIAASGAVRVIDLTPALSVRPLDGALQGQLDRYLELLATTHANGLRHLTLDALGEGQRQLHVSYISEVPVWKSTYRMVFPREANGSAIVQGWAVVDNTVGADWDNVQLSLVAGAPQSFIQPLSQPLYTRRPEVPIATAAQTTPQTHEAAESGSVIVPHDITMLAEKEAAPTAAFSADAESLNRPAGRSLRAPTTRQQALEGGVFRPTDALAEGAVSTSAFDDFFEYALAQPVTIHKNESAMVPILQQELPAEHVTLWSARDPKPLRAVWLENKSQLTLDSGSFSIFENGEFAGEGLLDPVHPGEKRLLSYAVDQAIKVRRTTPAETRTVRHISLHDGILIEQTAQVTETNYTVASAASDTRTVLIEHARRAGAELDGGTKPEETTADAYRFRLQVAPHQSANLRVTERATVSERVVLSPDLDRTALFISVGKLAPVLEEKLRPLIEAESALAAINRKLADAEKAVTDLTADEARARENLTALKGNEAGKRFLDELNRAEDQLQATQRQRTDLQQQKAAAVEKLNGLIAQASFDWDVEGSK